MSVLTTAEELRVVRAKLQSLEEGGVAEYSVGSRKVVYDLEGLRAREGVLVRRLQSESGSGLRANLVTFG